MVMVCAGQRSAQRPQRMQMVSSLTITEPSPAESSSGRDAAGARGCANRKLRGQAGAVSLRELELAQGNELQAIFRADIHAAAAEDALGAVGFVALENRIDPALQATRRFPPGLLLGEAGFDFGDAGAPVEGDHRHSQAGIFVVLLGHLVMIEDRDLHVLGLGLPFRSRG